MKLLLDIGNSRVKQALYQKGELYALPAFAYTLETLVANLREHWQRLEASQAEIWVSNVAGAQVAQAVLFCAQVCGLGEVHFLRSAAIACGVYNAYAKPESLGIDRWAAVIGAHAMFDGRPLCVVDCGTAVTLDALSADGRHLGGLIIPGVRLMRAGLVHATHALDSLNGLDSGVDKGIAILATETLTAINSGTVYAVSGLVDKMVEYLNNNGHAPMQCLFTGGDSESLMRFADSPCIHVPDLVLRGIACLADEPVCV